MLKFDSLKRLAPSFKKEEAIDNIGSLRDKIFLWRKVGSRSNFFET